MTNQPPQPNIQTSNITNITDNLTPYIIRINDAVGYTGTSDREDVRSILKELLKSASHTTAQEILKELPEESPSREPMDRAYNACLKACKAVVEKRLK